MQVADLVDTDKYGSVARYARLMAHKETWGGETELYLLAGVLGLTVEVYDQRMELMFRYSPAAGHTAHAVKVCYDGEKHYDAVLDVLPADVAMLDLVVSRGRKYS
jgi:hypothetical protein